MFIKSQEGDALYNIGMAECVKVINGCIMADYSGKSHVLARYSKDSEAEVAFRGIEEAIADEGSLPFAESVGIYSLPKE